MNKNRIEEGQIVDDIEGRVIIITGAGAGIGRATTLAFSRKGANVVLADIDPDSGNQLAEETGSGRSRCLSLHRAEVPFWE